MNQIHIISGTAIATIALVLVTATMSDQQSAFAHRSHHNHGGGSAAAAAAAGGAPETSAAASEGATAAGGEPVVRSISSGIGWNSRHSSWIR